MTTTTAPTVMPTSMAQPRAPSRWLRVAAWSTLAVLVAAACALFSLVDELSSAPLSITIDDTTISGLDLAALPGTHKLALAALLALGALLGLLLALAVLVVVVVALVPVLLLTVGLPVLAVGAVLLALLSPLLLLAWCLWRVLRPRPATIAA
jgi:hypothetical protein